MNLHRIASCWLALLLMGCATPVPTANIPVPVACINLEDKPVRPALATDAELAALDDYKLALALDLYRLQAGPYLLKLEAIVEACAKAGSP